MAIAARDWLQLSRLLDTALSLPPGERDTWIAALDAQHDPLKKVLRELLNRGDLAETGDFLATLPKLTAGPPRIEIGIAPGDLIGPYRVEREIGTGGMASVWLAERIDGLLKRKVALKLPHLGAAFHGLVDRMTRERNILAALEHSNIARLYDAGVAADGRPYLALEYVEGEPIDRYCERHGVDITGRLQFVLQVARAVAYAHAHLVVHRDLKPSNIQVDANGGVHLLDFGIAKLLGDEASAETPLTRAAGTALTPEYASPEQIRGEPVSTATDVYSLGVVLYELLTGTRFHKVKQRAAAASSVLPPGELPRPSDVCSSVTTRRRLRGDLDTITLKALKIEPHERYATIAELADDIEHFLRGEPVRARPDSTWYRARKFVSRHRFGVAAAASAVLALTAALAVAAWQAEVARQHATTAQREAGRARAVQGFLTDLFIVNTDDQEDPVRARQTTARELLDRGAARLQESLRDSPEAQDEVIATLADMYHAVGSDSESAALRRQRIEVRKKIFGERDWRVAEAMIDYAQEAEATEDRLNGPRWLERASAVLAAAPDAPVDLRVRLLEEEARASQYIAITRMRDKAREARALIEQSGRQTDQLAAVLRIEANANRWLGHWPESVALFERSLAQIRHRGPDGSFIYDDVGLTVTNFLESADVYIRMGRLRDAERAYKESQELTYRRNGEAHVDTVHVETRYASFLRETGRVREAKQMQATALRHAELTKGADIPAAAGQVQRTVTTALLDEGLIEEAAPLIVKDVEMRMRLFPNSIALVNSLYGQCRLELAFGRYEETERILQQAWDISRAALGPAAHPVSDNRFLLLRARVRIATGKVPEAMQDLQVVLTNALPGGAEIAVDHLWARTLLAAAHLRIRENERAQSEASAVLNELRRSTLRNSYQTLEAEAELRLGQAQVRLGQAAAARAPLEHVLKLRTANYDAKSGEIEEAMLALADCLAALGDSQRASAMREQAARIRAAHAKLAPPLIGAA